jgi:hypothetical protein
MDPLRVETKTAVDRVSGCATRLEQKAQKSGDSKSYNR